MGELTQDKPKTMVHVRGLPLLGHIAEAYKSVGIKNMLVVRGYKKESVNLPRLTYVDNEALEETGELQSLLNALQALEGRCQTTIISYGDVLFNTYIPQTLLQAKDDFVLFVDSHWQEKSSYTRLGGFAECTAPNSRKAFYSQIYLKQLGTEIPPDLIHGVWMGFFKASARGVTHVHEILPGILANPAHRKAGMATLFQELLRTNHPIRVLYTVGHWLDINHLEDVVKAGSFSESF